MQPRKNLKEKVGVLGGGFIASSMVKFRDDPEEYDEGTTGVGIEFSKFLVRDTDKPRDPVIPREKITSDPDEFFKADPDIVVDATDSEDPTYVLRTLREKIPVVFVNKVIADYLPQIIQTARKYRTNIAYNACVGGESRFCDWLSTYLGHKPIIEGVVNTTTNVILRLIEQGQSYDEALGYAIKEKIAEPDPTKDVENIDAAKKATLMTYSAYGVPIDWKRIPRQGIPNVTTIDTKLAEMFGCKIRSLVNIRQVENGILGWIGPTLLPSSDRLASLVGKENLVNVFKKGKLEPYSKGGTGAGEHTVNSALRDIVDIAWKKHHNIFDEYQLNSGLRALELMDSKGSFYFRVALKDVKWASANVEAAIARSGINIYDDKHYREAGARYIPKGYITHPNTSYRAVRRFFRLASKLDNISYVSPQPFLVSERAIKI